MHLLADFGYGRGQLLRGGGDGFQAGVTLLGGGGDDGGALGGGVGGAVHVLRGGAQISGGGDHRFDMAAEFAVEIIGEGGGFLIVIGLFFIEVDGDGEVHVQ